MKRLIHQIWQEDEGVLSFEWALLATLVIIGIISGITAARDAFIDELGDIAEATINFDQSYSFAGIPALGIDSSSYDDTPADYDDCDRIP